MWSSISVDEGSGLLKVAGSWEDQVGVVSSFITSVTLVDNESVFWNFLMSEVIGTEENNDLSWWSIGGFLGGDSEFESVDSSDIAVENVETVPVVLLANKIGVFLELVDVVHHGWSIGSLEGQRAGQDHWEIGLLKSLAEWVGTLGECLESLVGVTEMEIVVWQLWGRANNNDFEAVDGNSLLDSSVQNWVLKFGVATDEDEKISFVNACDSRVHQILASEIGVEVWSVVSNIDVIRIQFVHEISEGADGLDISELADLTLNLVTWDGLELLSSEFHGLFPSQLSERTILLSSKRNRESLLLKTIEGMSGLVADPLFIDFLVDSWENSEEV